MARFRASAVLTDAWEHFDFDIDASGIATLTFARPERLNALTFDVYADLRDLLTQLPLHSDVKTLIITGSGRGFCAGGDVDDIIGALVAMDPDDLLQFTRMTGTVIQRMRECPVPIVAAVNGIAAGAGAVIALAADFRLLGRSAAFAFLFTRVGLSGGDMGSAYLLPRLVGLGRATELLMLGDRIEAETAERYGLASAVHDDDDLIAAARSLAERLASGPTLAYAATKLLLTREQDMGLSGALELEAAMQALLMKTTDFREAYRAFVEGRREPRWTGR